MYSDADLDAAVAAGAIPAGAAIALRAHVAAGRAAPAADEEHFRLITGFNDIFVSIALVLFLLAAGWLGGSIASGLGGAAVAASSWGLAEYFTRQRRMALPSILLLLSFVGGIAAAVLGVAGELAPYGSDRERALIGAGAATAAAIGAALHWRRFQVPITVAAGAVALAGVVAALILSALGQDQAQDVILVLLLLAGLAIFAFAMRWDSSDRERRTRRSDVAFWLHLAAAPMIAHAAFNGLGVFGGGLDAGKSLAVLALYLVFAVVALAIDRRALLVSSLVYVLYAMRTLFSEFGAIESNFALTGLVIGSALLMLSAFWQPIRRIVVGALPESLQARLPAAEPLPARTAAAV